MRKPTKVVPIKMLTADGCKRCAEVEARILDAEKSLNISVKIIKIDCLSDEAVQLGVKFGLSDVPSFVIDGQGFDGYFSARDLFDALRSASNHSVGSLET